MTAKTKAAARNLAAAAEELKQSKEDVTDDDRELIEFAAEHLRPLLKIRDADTSCSQADKDALLDRAMAVWSVFEASHADTTP